MRGNWSTPESGAVQIRRILRLVQRDSNVPQFELLEAIDRLKPVATFLVSV